MMLYYKLMLSLSHTLSNLLYKLQKVLLPTFYKVSLRERKWFAQSHMANES